MYHIDQKKKKIPRKRIHTALQKFETWIFWPEPFFLGAKRELFVGEGMGTISLQENLSAGYGDKKQVWGAALWGWEAITEKGIWQEEIFEAENENMKEDANSLDASIQSLRAVSVRLSNKKRCSRSSAVKHHSFAYHKEFRQQLTSTLPAPAGHKKQEVNEWLHPPGLYSYLAAKLHKDRQTRKNW